MWACFALLQSTRRVALKETVDYLRTERFGCVQLLNHYLYLTQTCVNYAVQATHVHAEDIGPEVLMFDLIKH